jgi:hypothetical protein
MGGYLMACDRPTLGADQVNLRVAIFHEALRTHPVMAVRGRKRDTGEAGWMG